MHSARPTTNWLSRTFGLIVALLTVQSALAQENSPYSRYGLGDVVPNQNIVNRGMGGVSFAVPNFLSINLSNPALLGNISNTRNFSNAMFELGAEADIRNLKSTTTPDKFRSVNAVISYLQIAFPLSSKRMERKGNFWGMSIGLRPVTRINYKIEKTERLAGIDSLQTLYEGSGGLNQVNVSTGIRIKKINIGVSTGYSFGTRDYSTKLNFINDSAVYYKSNTEARSQFGGAFFQAGLFYASNSGRKRVGDSSIAVPTINFGAFFSARQRLTATRDKINETFNFTSVGTVATIDTVDYRKEESGRVVVPMTWGVGFSYQDKHRNWLIGADFEATSWTDYRFYDEKDDVRNNWVIRVGAEYYPAREGSAINNYWSFVKYRAGFNYSPDYVVLNRERATYTATVGASFPLTSAQRIRFGEYVLLNTGFEFGGRGNKNSQSVRESIMRFSFGISMNARWFQKRSYD